MKYVRGAFLSFLLVLLAASIASADNGEKNFRVGVIAPLSGPLAEYGIAAKNGIEIAKEEHPELFSKIDFLYEDSQWVAKMAVAAFNKLQGQDKVSLIMNWGNPTTEAVAPLAERNKMPLIGMSLDPKAALGKRYVIRSTNGSDHFSAKLGDYLRRAGYKRLGVVLSENTYVQGLYDGLQASLKYDDVELEIIDRYNLGDQDFRSSVTKIRRKNYDAVGVFLISGQVSSFYRQLTSQGISIPTFGTDFFESTTEIKNSGTGIDGAVYPHLGVSEVFRECYMKKFGDDLQIAYAGNWHDMAFMIGRLFHNKTNLSPDEVMKLLRKQTVYDGVGGKFRFRETDIDGPYYEFPVRLKRVKGESIVVIADE